MNVTTGFHTQNKKKVLMLLCESSQKIQYLRSHEKEMQPKCTEDSPVICQ